MPETIEEYYARIEAAVDDEGRLALIAADIPNWDIFPFEADGLRLKPVDPLADVEAPRHGEEPADCWCVQGVDPEHVVWRDEHWFVGAFERSGAPVIMMLTPCAHHDFINLPSDLAAEMGRLMVALGAAIESLPSVARVHMSKWGDGGAHLHLFFFARPTRMPQLRGTCLALWDDFLPPVPDDVRDDNTRAVVTELVRTYGGRAVGSAASG
ncbi:MAG: hypothetical protein WKF54_05535 [Nocardioidaceae bacterium]